MSASLKEAGMDCLFLMAHPFHKSGHQIAIDLSHRGYGFLWTVADWDPAPHWHSSYCVVGLISTSLEIGLSSNGTPPEDRFRIE
jgi:hypothetical protein